MERLLLYSLEHKSAIRMIYMENEVLVQRNVLVEKICQDTVDVYVPKTRKHTSINKKDILSVDFRKSDDAMK